MEVILPAMFLVLLCLACPLGMAIVGGVAWLIARTKRQKTEGAVSGSV